MPDEPQGNNTDNLTPTEPVVIPPTESLPSETPVDITAVDTLNEIEPSTESLPGSTPPVAFEAIQEDAATSTPVVGTTAVITSKPKSTKKLIIGLIIVAVLAVLGVGSALAYNLWYQNPQKMITDAIINAATAKSSIYTGTVTIDSEGTKLKLDVTTKQKDTVGSLDAKITVSTGGKDYTVDGSALFDKSGDLYFKVQNINDLVDQYKTSIGIASGTSLDTTIKSLISKIDNTWIKVDSEDLKSVSESYATTKTCVDDAVTKFKDDSAAKNEISDLYQKHQFIIVSKNLGTKDGSIGYSLKSDQAAADAFAEGLKTTKIYKTLHDCDSTFTIEKSTVDKTTANTTGTFELWIDSWSHQITAVNFSDTSNGSTLAGVLKPSFNKDVTVETPSSSTTLAQLQKDITELLQSAFVVEDTQF